MIIEMYFSLIDICVIFHLNERKEQRQDFNSPCQCSLIHRHEIYLLLIDTNNGLDTADRFIRKRYRRAVIHLTTMIKHIDLQVYLR